MSHRASLAALFVVLFALAARAEDASPWDPVGEILGKKGDKNADGSYRVNIPRDDVVVKGRFGLPIPSAMGLATYAAFAGTPDDATVVGDTCMLAHEVDPVIDALRAGRIDVVALHNHMTISDPAIFFLHFEGHGKSADLAKTVRAAFDKLGTPAPVFLPGPTPGAPGVDFDALAKTLGRPVQKLKDGVGKFSLPRADLSILLDGKKLPPGTGPGCWAAFYPCPCGRTMVTGDTCVTREELQPALDALRKAGIGITAIHNHFLGEETRVMFMHFEAEGDAAAIAAGIRAAWDATGAGKK